MSEIRFKQSDVVYVVGLSESSIIRYRKKKIFVATFEPSKHGKTYFVDALGIKQIINEYNIGRTVDPVQFVDVMIRLYQRAGLRPPPEYIIEYGENNTRQPLNNIQTQYDNHRSQYEKPLNNQTIVIEQPLNTNHEYGANRYEYEVDIVDNSQKSNEDSHDNSQPKQGMFDINDPPAMEEFIVMVAKKMIEGMKDQLNKQIDDLVEKYSENQILLSEKNKDYKQLKEDKKEVEDKARGYEMYFEIKKAYKEATWWDKYIKKDIQKPNPKQYGMEKWE